MSAWEIIKSAIRTIAPTIATAIGGPLAGNAARDLSNLFLGKPDGSADDIAHAAQNPTPEQVIELSRLELEYIKLQNEDKDSARKMYSAAVETMGHPDFITRYLTIWASLLFTAVIFLSPFVNDLHEKAILSFLFNLVTNICSFYFGRSSKS